MTSQSNEIFSEEIALMTQFLFSWKADSITGQCFTIDNGTLARLSVSK